MIKTADTEPDTKKAAHAFLPIRTVCLLEFVDTAAVTETGVSFDRRHALPWHEFISKRFA
jgi:hypothetical protein